MAPPPLPQRPPQWHSWPDTNLKHSRPPPPGQPQSEPAGQSGQSRRLQRAVVQAMRYRRNESQAAEGLTFQEVRNLLPRRTWNPPPTDADLRAAVAISERRLWLEPPGAHDPGIVRIYCAPKDKDPQRHRTSRAARSYSQVSLSLETRSTQRPSRLETRKSPCMPGTTPCPKRNALSAPSERRPSSGTPRSAPCSSSSRSSTPPRKTRRQTRTNPTPPRSMSVISFANAQELQSAFTNFLNTLNLPQAPKDHLPVTRTTRTARKHDRCPADSDSEPAPRRTKKQTRPHAKETKETRSIDR